MKIKIGDIQGTPLVTVTSVADVTYNDIVVEKIGDNIDLKKLNTSGNLESILKKETITVEIDNSIPVTLGKSIMGPDKWVKDNVYIFYVAKNTEFKVLTIKNKNITDKAELIATGLDYKVYQLPTKYCQSVTIK